MAAPPAPAAGRPDPTGLEVTHIERRPSIWKLVRDSWHELRLLPRFGVRFLQKFIHGTKLGGWWLLIRPLMDSLGKTLLFGSVLKVTTPGAAPYFLFVLAGLLGWRLFERGMLYACRSFTLYGKLMKSFHFPLLLVPLGSLAYPALEVVVYWLVFVGALIFFWATDGVLYLQGFPQILLVVPGIGLALMTTIGSALWVSVLNAKARDVRYTLRYVMPIWLYLTPIVYPISQLPPSLRILGTINPMSAPIEMIKSGLINAGYFDIASVMCSLVFGGLLLASGLWFFTREAARSIDVYGGMDDDEEEEDEEEDDKRKGRRGKR